MGAAKHARVSSGHRPFCILAAALAASFAFAAVAPAPTASANEKVFRKVTAEDNEQARALLAEGDALRKAGDYEAAAKKYTRAIFYNEYLGGYAFRALCRMKLGDYDGAATDADTSMHLRRAKDLLRPDMNGLAEYVAGICAYEKGDNTAAEAYFQKIEGTPYAKDPDVQRIRQEAAAKAVAERAAKAAAEHEATLQKFRTLIGSVDTSGPMFTGDDGWWQNLGCKEVFEATAGSMQDFAGVVWELRLSGSQSGPQKPKGLISLPLHYNYDAASDGGNWQDTLFFFELWSDGTFLLRYSVCDDPDIYGRTQAQLDSENANPLTRYTWRTQHDGNILLRDWMPTPIDVDSYIYTFQDIQKKQAGPKEDWPSLYWGRAMRYYDLKAAGDGTYAAHKGMEVTRLLITTGDEPETEKLEDTVTGTLTRIGHI